jgi:hypothetical protein
MDRDCVREHVPRNMVSEYLNLPIYHLQIRPLGLDPLHGSIENLLDMRRIVRHAGQRDRCRLPTVVVIDLGSRDIEFLVQTRQQRFQHGALALQRLVTVEMQFDETGSNNHDVILA